MTHKDCDIGTTIFADDVEGTIIHFDNRPETIETDHYEYNRVFDKYIARLHLTQNTAKFETTLTLFGFEAHKTYKYFMSAQQSFIRFVASMKYSA